MSIRIVVVGYAFTLFATILGCFVIARPRPAGNGMWWTIGGLSCALAGMVMWAGIGFFPDFITVVLANEAMLVAFILLHQAIATGLSSPRRLAALGVLLAIGQFLLFLYFTYVAPNMQARILVRTSAIFIQVGVSTFLLFANRDSALRYEARAAGWVFALFAVLQASQVVVTSIMWQPTPNRLHPDPVLAFYYVFNFIIGLSCWFAVIWLAICEHRQDLQIMATTDGLSGLMNRGAFDAALKRELRPGNRRRMPMALLLIDLDHFKAINDSHGHQAGDEVIRRVGRLLHANVRPTDGVARYGGDEFAVLLKGTTSDEAEVLAERLRAQVEQMAEFSESVRVTASIGIAIRRDSDTSESLFKRCDESLYLSKRLSRNRVSALECAFQDT